MLSGKSTNRPLKPKLGENYGYTFLHILLDITFTWLPLKFLKAYLQPLHGWEPPEKTYISR